MNTIKINKNSKTYRFARDWGKWDYYLNNDICSFRRALVWGATKLVVLIGSFTFMYLLMGLSHYEDFVKAGYSYPLLLSLLAPLFYFIVGLLILSVISVLMFGALKVYQYLFKRKSKSEDKQPSAIALAYKSFKEKYCTKVEII